MAGGEKDTHTAQLEHLLSSNTVTIYFQMMLQVSHLFFNYSLRKLYDAFSLPDCGVALWKELPETLAQFVNGLVFI